MGLTNVKTPDSCLFQGKSTANSQIPNCPVEMPGASDGSELEGYQFGDVDWTALLGGGAKDSTVGMGPSSMPALNGGLTKVKTPDICQGNLASTTIATKKKPFGRVVKKNWKVFSESVLGKE